MILHRRGVGGVSAFAEQDGAHRCGESDSRFHVLSAGINQHQTLVVAIRRVTLAHTGGGRRTARFVWPGIDLSAFDVGENLSGPSQAHLRSRSGYCAAGEELVVILRILEQTQSELFHVALAGRAAGVFSGPSEDGKQDGRQNRDNCNYNEQFDKGKYLNS